MSEPEEQNQREISPVNGEAKPETAQESEFLPERVENSEALDDLKNKVNETIEQEVASAVTREKTAIEGVAQMGGEGYQAEGAQLAEKFESEIRGAADSAEGEVTRLGRGSDGQEEKESSRDMSTEQIKSSLEHNELLDGSFRERAHVQREKYIKKFGLPAEAKGEDILKAIDGVCLADLKTRAFTKSDQAIIDEYAESTEEKPLSYEKRQELLNFLASSANKIYKNEKGENVSLGEYLKDYYGSLGVEVGVVFDTVPTEMKENLLTKMQMLDEKANEAEIEYLRNDAIPVPIVEIQKGSKTLRIPLFGGNRSIAMPVRQVSFDSETGERQSKRVGTAIGVFIVHAPENGGTVHMGIGDMVHEIDHGVRDVLDNQETFMEEHRMVLEGTAELAKMRFFQTQDKADPDKGFDYFSTLATSVSASSEGELGGGYHADIESTYGSGYVLADQIEKDLGKEGLWQKAYDSQYAIPRDQLGDLRRTISAKFDVQKDDFENFMVK